MSAVQSSRLFVSGLPPKITNDQLAAHFRGDSRFRVTDAHVIPDRRIGFVGLADSTRVEDAVKHFNKTYIRMSKISVDVAKPIEVQKDENGNPIPLSARSTKFISDNGKDKALKRKRAQNDDGENLRSSFKGENHVGPLDSVKHGSTEPTTPIIEHGKGQSDEDENDNGVKDKDWLRAKTSRVLDLIDPEEEAGFQRIQQDQVTEDSMLDSKMTDMVEENEEDDDGDEQAARTIKIPNARLFVRNLAFHITDVDILRAFEKFGKVSEAHVVKDPRKSTSKGTAFVQFSDPQDAENALKALDGTSYQGRLLHILPASDKRNQGLSEYDLSKMPLKQQRRIKQKLTASKATFSWNSLYMNPDAVLTSIADRLGVSKSEILDPTSSDAAIKQAHAETQLIKETKAYLSSCGVNLDAFKIQARDDRIILLKNFPFGTSEAELRSLLEPFGMLKKFLFPPSGTMALAQFDEPYAATQALKHLAYKNIKGSVLFLEKAPRGLLDGETYSANSDAESKEVEQQDSVSESSTSTTVFVRNLNFSTTSRRLKELVSTLPGFVSARVKTRTDEKRPGEVLSMGFGFVEFSSESKAKAAVDALNKHVLDGHELVVQISTKHTDMAEERRQQDKAKKQAAAQSKIIIKNLPFQASKKDIRALFSPYGQLKTVRVPKKFDNTTRGFAFAEFITPKEAQNAVDSLSNTHLLGRRLVLEFTQGDDNDPEEDLAAIERKIEQQSKRVNLSKLIGTSGRRKFNVDTTGDDGY